MTKFVGAEYVVANMLIAEKKKGKNYVSFDRLGKYGIYVQAESIKKDIDVIFLTSRPQFLFRTISNAKQTKMVSPLA